MESEDPRCSRAEFHFHPEPEPEERTLNIPKIDMPAVPVSGDGRIKGPAAIVPMIGTGTTREARPTRSATSRTQLTPRVGVEDKSEYLHHHGHSKPKRR